MAITDIRVDYSKCDSKGSGYMEKNDLLKTNIS